jgi:hypothetical protein
MKTRLTKHTLGLVYLVAIIGAPIVAQSLAESPRETPAPSYRPMSERERKEFNARNMEAARRATMTSQSISAESAETRPVDNFFVRGQERVRDAGLTKLFGYMRAHANRSSTDLTSEALTTFQASGHDRPVESINFAIHCVNNRVPIHILKEWLGHANIMNTAVYSHMLLKRKSIMIAYV